MSVASDPLASVPTFTPESGSPSIDSNQLAESDGIFPMPLETNIQEVSEVDAGIQVDAAIHVDADIQVEADIQVDDEIQVDATSIFDQTSFDIDIENKNSFIGTEASGNNATAADAYMPDTESSRQATMETATATPSSSKFYKGKLFTIQRDDNSQGIIDLCSTTSGSPEVSSGVHPNPQGIIDLCSTTSGSPEALSGVHRKFSSAPALSSTSTTTNKTSADDPMDLSLRSSDKNHGYPQESLSTGNNSLGVSPDSLPTELQTVDSDSNKSEMIFGMGKVPLGGWKTAEESSDEQSFGSGSSQQVMHYTEHVFINDALIRQVQRMTLNSVISLRDKISVYNVNEGEWKDGVVIYMQSQLCIVLFPTDKDLKLLEQQKNENLPMKDDGAFKYDGLIESYKPSRMIWHFTDAPADSNDSKPPLKDFNPDLDEALTRWKDCPPDLRDCQQLHAGVPIMLYDAKLNFWFDGKVVELHDEDDDDEKLHDDDAIIATLSWNGSVKKFNMKCVLWHIRSYEENMSKRPQLEDGHVTCLSVNKKAKVSAVSVCTSDKPSSNHDPSSYMEESSGIPVESSKIPEAVELAYLRELVDGHVPGGMNVVIRAGFAEDYRRPVVERRDLVTVVTPSGGLSTLSTSLGTGSTLRPGKDIQLHSSTGKTFKVGSTKTSSSTSLTDSMAETIESFGFVGAGERDTNLIHSTSLTYSEELTSLFYSSDNENIPTYIVLCYTAYPEHNKEQLKKLSIRSSSSDASGQLCNKARDYLMCFKYCEGLWKCRSEGTEVKIICGAHKTIDWGNDMLSFRDPNLNFSESFPKTGIIKMHLEGGMGDGYLGHVSV